ncbi:MAG: TonB-dependent receptor [Nitrospirales bacterium]|nr:TonB-dependent receptor [Nitrospira sp.]MDR4501505.1 TonB-dependent receptor [Nitrospirales bacterium]
MRVASGSEAQEPEITQLDPVIVTASVLPTTALRSTASVRLITRNDIERQQANRFAELLQQVPGLHVDEMGGRGGISSVYIRGGDPNFTLVLIDGVPINDPTNQRGGSVDLSTLTPERIEQIEIIRGPLSARYGSEAVSGVINIRTQQGSEESHQSLRVAGGRFGYTREVLQANGPIGPATYALSLSHTRNDEEVKHDRFQLGTVGWHINWLDDLPIDVRLTGKFTHTHSRAFPEGSGGSRLAFLQDTERRNTSELVSGLHLDHQLLPEWKQALSVNLFRRTQDSDNPGVLATPVLFGIPPNTSRTTYTRIQPTWIHSVTLIPEWSVAVGMQETIEIGKRRGNQELTAVGAPSNQRSNFENTRSTSAFFAELSATLSDDVQMTGGLRVDIPEGFETELSPRVGFNYQATPTTRLRAGYSEGFKLPSMASLGDPFIGNSRLRPETSRGWDVSVQHSFAQYSGQVELTYFRNTFSRLIDLEPTLARMGIFQLVNLRTVHTQGIELAASLSPLTGYSIQGFMTYLDTNIQGTSDHLRNRPTWSGGVILLAEPSPSWTLRAQIRAVGQRFDLQIPTQDDRAPGYVKSDLTMTYRPTSAWSLFGVLENFTDSHYEEFLGFEAPGITFRFGLTYAR